MTAQRPQLESPHAAAWFLVSFAVDEWHGYIAGSRLPRHHAAHSALVDIGYNHQATAWQDHVSHHHSHSEEYYLVTQGCLILEADGETVSVPAGHLFGVKAATAHRVAGGRGPLESFSFRVPGDRRDKVIVRQSQSRSPGAWFLLDLHAPVSDYQAGACLPPTSPAYSPWWDFWSGWQRSLSTWQGQERHVHSHAEEYYVVLQGRLDLEVDGTVIPVEPGCLLGVRPGAPHVIVGGQEPVDTFFLRVPGGRGDKTVVGPHRL